MKKRIASIVLALSLIAGFALPAMAALKVSKNSTATIKFQDGQLEFVTDGTGKLGRMDFPFGIKDRPLGAVTYYADPKAYKLSVQDNRGAESGDRKWKVTVKMGKFTFDSAPTEQEFNGSITLPGKPSLSALNVKPGDNWGTTSDSIVINTDDSYEVVDKTLATDARDAFNLDWINSTTASLHIDGTEAKKDILIGKDYTAQVMWTLEDV